MSVGQELAEARRNLGLSLETLSSQIGFSVEVLRAIEDGDLLQLPSGIALKGALKAYAGAVQLDADAVSERYVAELPILPDTTDVWEAFEPERKEHGPSSASSLFTYESAYEPSVSSGSSPQAADAAGPVLLLRAERAQGASSLPIVHHDGVAHDEPTRDRAIRFPVAVLLLASALAVVAGYMLSARGDWWPRDRSPRAANRVMASDSAHERQPDPNVAQAVAPKTAPSPPASAATSAEAPPPPALSTAPVKAKEAPGARAPERPTTPVSPRAVRALDPPVPSAVIVVPGSQPASAPTSSAAPATSSAAPATLRANQGELAGAWNVIAHDEAATAETDSNRIAYYLRLEQRGSHVTGSGYRVGAYGADRTSSQQSVGVRGVLSGERLTLDFTGQNHEHFVLYRSEDGTFRGRFRRTDAPASGSLLVTLSPKAPAR
jgi:cytoskeletal protein RodZ